MPRITNTDQVLILLKAQLKQMERTGKPVSAPKGGPVRKSPMERLKSLLSDDENLRKEDARQLLVQNLLADSVGPHLTNDPAFQSIVASVSQILESDHETSALVDRAIERVAQSS